MSNSWDKNDNEACLKCVDAAGGYQACGESGGEGDRGAAESESRVWMLEVVLWLKPTEELFSCSSSLSLAARHL